MSNAELRIQALHRAAGSVPKQSPSRGQSRVSAAAGRRRTVIAWLFCGDVLSGVVAITAATFCVAKVSSAAHWLPQPVFALPAFLIGLYWVVGLYRDRGARRSLVERFRLRANAVLLFAFAGMLLFPREDFVSGTIIVWVSAALALVLGLWIEHAISAHLIHRGLWIARAAILGDTANARALARRLQTNPEWGLVPVGILDDGRSPTAISSSDTPTVDPELPVFSLMNTNSLSSIEVLIVPDVQTLPNDSVALYGLGIEQVLVMAETANFPTFGMQIRHFDGCIAFEMGGAPCTPSPTIKRLVDLALVFPLAPLVAFLVCILAVAVKIADPGPAFYRQKRVGRGGRSIEILKLRTMYRDAELRLQQLLDADPVARAQWDRHFKLSQDPRILPRIGTFLRRTSLDELPQIWNVIRGDMSLVGPRPFPAYHMDAFDPEFRALRLSVQPGLTGVWQISARSEGNLSVQRAQDCFYIRHRSLWLDLYVLMATLPAVFIGRGAK
jgi:exopolysaccharide biosynthesis polyprenyl glycosylphosphotransferase